MSQHRTLYCENGCGYSITAAALELNVENVKAVKIEMECPLCEEDTEFIEDLTVTVTFKCTGCKQKKRANTKPVRGQAKTTHHCGECQRETEWRETGWEHIEVA